jgi:3-phenylpropionate/trans-cinnamate dioxygenase ferredoxin reductase subunit
MSASPGAEAAQAEPVVVVGAGQGGFQTAVSLREGGHTGPITIVGDEAVLPYQRPPLSKAYLVGAVSFTELAVRSESFFASRGITTRCGDPARAIDRDRHEVVLASGDRLPYAHLVLATGARARSLRVPGAELDGVLLLRSLADADMLRPALDGVADVVVVGGGFVGMEVAASARSLGHAVTVVEGLGRTIARAVAPEISAHVTAVHQARGTTFRLERGVVAVHGTGGRVREVELDTGERIPAGLVVVGIGVMPNTELAEAAGLGTGDGVLVDEWLRTCDLRISAIGDCADYPSVHARGRVRLESVQNAVDQARYVAARLTAGAGPRYRAVPWFWTYQYDQKIQMAGVPVADGPRMVRGDAAGGRFSVFRFDAERTLTSVESVNRASDHMAARQLLAGDRRPTADQVANPAFDLKAYATA